ncbi:MAG: hypothetical protein J6N51_07120 [Selenomonas sp.]|nr:hypothetical protein [Selenomonas sp.]
MPEIIRNADQVSAKENTKNKRNASQYTYLTSKAIIEGKEQPVEITIFTDANGNRYYNHILPMEEQNKRSLSVYPAQASNEESGIPAVRQQASSTSSIPQGQKEVEKKNSDRNIAEGAESKPKRTKKTKVPIELTNDNQKFMEDKSVEQSPVVQEYKGKVESILEDWKAKKITKSRAEIKMKDLMAEANRDYYDGKLSSDEKLAAQGFASNAYGQLKAANVKKPSSNRKYSIDGKPIVGVRKYSAAWHGSPHKFDTFTLEAIGTGEGAQVHGWGLYFAKERSVSEGYREQLSKYLPTIRINGYEVTKKPSGWTALLDAQTGETEFIGKNTIEGAALEAFTEAKGDLGEAEKYLIEKYGEAKKRYIDEAIDFLREENVELLEKPGSLFQVEIPDEDVMLDEQKKFDEQPEKVQKALRKLISESPSAQKHIAFAEQIYESDGKKIYGIVSGLAEGDAPRGADLDNIQRLGSELLNKYGIKGITYEGGRDGRCYVVFDDQAIEIVEKLSAQGKEIQRLINQMKAVADKNLTAQQKMIRDFAKQMGVNVRWMKGHPDLHGFYATDGSIVLNVNSDMSLTKTFYHELFHWLADNNPQLYAEMFDYIEGLDSFSKAQLDAYRKKIKRPDMTDELAIEEMLADEFEEVTKRAKFVKELANRNPGLAERFIAWVKRVMNKFVKYFHGQDGGLSPAQRNTFVHAFGALAKDMVDDKGNKLFRVSADGKSILTRQGEPIESVGELSQENDRDNMTEAEYNVSKLRDTQRQELFERVNKKIDDHIKEQLRKGVSEEELYKEFQSSHSAHREAVLNGYRGAVREVEKIRNSETECRDFVKHYGYDVDGKRDYEVREAYELLLAQMKGVVDYAGFLYQEIVIDRARAAANPGLGLQVGDWRSADLQRQQRLRAAREAREVNNDNAEHAGNDQGALLNAKRLSFAGEKSKTAPIKKLETIRSNDNTSEGLMQRVKNILSGRATDAGATFRYRKHLTEMIEKALDVKVRYGKMEDKDGKVIYKPESRTIRSRHAFDWDNILPVAGRVAAWKLGIKTPTKEMCNYIGKWIMTGAPNDTSPEAKKFHAAMQEHRAVSAKLQDLRDAFAEWNDKDIKERMQGTISMENRQKRNWKETREAIYNEFVEELEPVNRLVKRINANLTEQGKDKLTIDNDPMVAFRMLRGSYGQAIAAIEGVNDEAVDKLKNAYPGVDFTGFKTIYQILESIDAFQNMDKQRDFITYCTACHILDMHAHNADIGLKKANDERLIEEEKEKLEKAKKRKDELLGRNMALMKSEVRELRTVEKSIERSKKEIKELEAHAKKWEKEIMPIPKEFSEENCKKYIKDGYKQYHQAQQDLVTFSNVTADILRDSGVISDRRYNDLRKKWPNYVPTFRVFEDNEDVDFGDSMKHIKGSMRDIINPLESIIRNTVQFIQKADTNKARQLLADLARCDSSGWLLEETEKTSDDKTIIPFLEDGQRKYLQTDPDIVRAVTNMGQYQSSYFVKFLHAITKVARTAFTMASPEFALRNVMRDWQDASLFTKYGLWINPTDIIKGMVHAYRRDGVYYEWLTQKSAQASALSLDRDYIIS